MSTFTRFSTPAHQGPKDFNDLGLSQGELDAFEQSWSDNVAGWTEMSIIGNPWSNDNDAPRSNYYNPLTDGMGTAGDAPVQWTPFPNRLLRFYTDANVAQGGQLSGPLTTDEVQALADTGQIDKDGKTYVLNDAQPGQELLKIPGRLCPELDWSAPVKDFSPPGPRGWQDEYCEWSITRNAQGQMQAVMFTCENPAYYLTLWRENPKAVLGLYQQYIDPAVQMDDLFLRYPADGPTGQKGDPVMDPTTGHPAYDPTNKWNRGPSRVPGSHGGAMHLTSPPNTLGAEIYLAAAATIPRSSKVNGDAQTLICCAKYGQNFRNSDPNIGYNANFLATQADPTSMLTLTDPVGLYIQQPGSFAGWQGPNGEDISHYWQIQRGHAKQGNDPIDRILHVSFAIPESAGFSIEDCTIWGTKIAHVGMILDQMKVALSVTKNGTPSTQAEMACVQDKPDQDMQPWPVQFVPQTLFYGLSASDLPALLRPGTTDTFVLIVQGAAETTTPQTAQVEFTDPNVTATVTEFLKDASAVPGQTDGGGTQGYVMQVTVASGAQPGPVGVRAINPGTGTPSPQAHPFEMGLAIVPGA